MRNESNEHGLSRVIPSVVARQVRANSKFGCVVCRGAICDYEHIEPEFKDAKEHSPKNICLLCPTCHGKVTRGQWSKQYVRQAYDRIQADPSVKPPYSDFDISSGNWSIALGPCKFQLPKAIFTIDGDSLLSFAPPENGVGLPLLSGVFCDDQGNVLLKIENNIWTSVLDNVWDIQVAGKVITIRKGPGKIALEIVVEPPNGIRVTHLDMRMALVIVRLTSLLEIERETPNGSTVFGIDGDCIGANSCVSVDTSIERPILRDLKMYGGQGIILSDTGITWGDGNGQAHIRQIDVNGQTVFGVSEFLK